MKASVPRSIILALLLAALVQGVALAHARLLRTSPEDGAVLAEPPREVWLWFDEPIAVQFSAAELLDAAGQPVGEVSVRADPADPDVLIATLPTVSGGVYSLAWKIISAVDSHSTQGTLVFGVNQAVEGVARPAANEVTIPPLEVLLRTLNYAALAVMIGGLLTAALVLRPAAFAPEAQTVAAAARRRMLAWSLAAAVVAFVVGAAFFAWRASTLERGSLWELLNARVGVLWLAEQGLLLIAGMALLGARRGLAWGWLSAGFAAVAGALLETLSSHAAALPENAGMAITAQAVHLLVAGAWVGSLVVMVVTLLPLLRSSDAERRAVALGSWRHFGRLAVLSVGVLAATGLYNTARQVVSLDAWLVTLYGQVLSGKIVVFLGVGLAGLINSALFHPRVAGVLGLILRRPAGWMPVRQGRLPFVLVTEALLGLVVLAVTGLLTAVPTARGPEFLPPDTTDKPPSALTQSVNDLLINLAIRPNKPGPNIVTVGAFSTRRPAPAEILRVLVRLKYQEKDLGLQTLIAEPAGENQYRLNSSALSLAGRWQVEVVVRRAGLADSVANFDWRVEPLAISTSPRPVLISNAPLAPGLTALAVGLIVVTGLALPALLLVGRSAGGTNRP